MDPKLLPPAVLLALGLGGCESCAPEPPPVEAPEASAPPAPEPAPAIEDAKLPEHDPFDSFMKFHACLAPPPPPSEKESPSIEVPGCLTITIQETRRRGGRVSSPPTEPPPEEDASENEDELDDSQQGAREDRARQDLLRRVAARLPDDVAQALLRRG